MTLFTMTERINENTHPAPLASQANFFYRMSPVRHAFPTYRFVDETEKCCAILDKRLRDRDFIAGHGRGKYSIVDMAVFMNVDSLGAVGVDLDKYGNVKSWWERVWARDAVKKGTMAPNGQPYAFGYESMQKMKKEDPKAWEAREGPLQKALEDARKQFGGS